MENPASVKSKIRLSPESYQGLLVAERNLHDLIPEMDKMEDCGIDCVTYRAALKEMLDRIEKMKLYYAP